MTDRTARALSAVALIALGLWIGGLVTLGAIVAPTVFAAIPLTEAADAMTVVFGRFDKLAAIAAAVVVATEALRVRLGRPALLDGTRAVLSLLCAAMAALEAAYVTPTIAHLHSSGAVRGVGDAGMALSSAHTLAEALGQSEAVVGLILIVLHVLTLGRGAAKTPTAGPGTRP